MNIREPVSYTHLTERETREAQVKAEAAEYFAEAFPDSKADIDNSLYAVMKEIVREKIVKEGVRPDGRGYEAVSYTHLCLEISAQSTRKSIMILQR